MTAPSSSPAPAYRVGSEGILDAATTLFAAEGYDRANMDAIAARAGITKPTLYARFGSKERLYGAAVQREYEVRKARLFDAYAEGTEEPFRDRLHRWSSAYFDLVRERPAGFALITEGERHPVAAALVREGNDEVVERIAGLVVEVSGRQARDGARLVAAMISGIFTACARAAVANRMELDDAARLCESFMLGALRGVDPKLIDRLG
jgi:AcrR family transcriptional regulator